MDEISTRKCDCHTSKRLSGIEDDDVEDEIYELRELFSDPRMDFRKSVSSRSHQWNKIEISNEKDVGVNENQNDNWTDDQWNNFPSRQLLARRVSIAGGFLDIALFSANCEQLKFVLELGYFHIYYKEVVALIITSLVLQLCVGFTIFLLGAYVPKKSHEESFANFLNHATMGLVALITIVNIFISTFGPKGTVMARCLGAFSYPNVSRINRMSFLNATLQSMLEGI